MSTAAQRRRQATKDLEAAAMSLIHFAETYNAGAANAQGYHRAKRMDLLEHARCYAAAVRRLARLRA